MKKKVVTLSLVVALIATAAIGGTLAYFTDMDNATNTFEVGNVEIDLVEEGWPEDGLSDVIPGVEYAKVPVVKNVGANNAWIRVDVTLDNAEQFMKAAAKHDITDLSEIFKEHNENAWTRVGDYTYNQAKNTLTYQYYYNKLLKTGEGVDAETEALFTGVVIPAEFDNNDLKGLKNFNITIVANAVQESDGVNSAAEAFAALADVEGTILDRE